MDQSKIEIIVIITFLILVALVTAILVYIYQYRRRVKTHQQQMKIVKQIHEKELIKAQYEMQVQTMQDIGREIHDNIGQKLTLASLYTHQLEFDAANSEIQNRINQIGSILTDSLSELRSLSKSLTNPTIEEKSLETLLEEEMKKLSETGLFKIEAKISTGFVCSNLVKSILYRMVQEFFQNSIKHAQASVLTLNLNHNDAGPQLFLADNGKGFDTEKVNTDRGIGLVNIKKRAALIEATMELKSVLDQGTSLLLFVPKDKLCK